MMFLDRTCTQEISRYAVCVKPRCSSLHSKHTSSKLLLMMLMMLHCFEKAVVIAKISVIPWAALYDVFECYRLNSSYWCYIYCFWSQLHSGDFHRWRLLLKLSQIHTKHSPCCSTHWIVVFCLFLSSTPKSTKGFNISWIANVGVEHLTYNNCLMLFYTYNTA